MKPFNERSREGQIELLRMIIKREGRMSLTTPVRYGLAYEDVLPFATRRTTVAVPTPGGLHISIPAVVADRRTALREMQAKLEDLEGKTDAA